MCGEGAVVAATEVSRGDAPRCARAADPPELRPANLLRPFGLFLEGNHTRRDVPEQRRGTSDGGEVPDEVLVVAAILGDLDAFDVLVKRYRPVVVRTARAVVGDAFAEDVAQDALLLAFKALPSIEDPERFPGWLRVVTRHRALRFRRQEDRHTIGRLELDAVLIDRLDIVADRREVPESAALREAVDALPPDYALALYLHYFDEMPLKRIAAALDVPVSTVKWRLHRGRRLLAARIDADHELRAALH